MYFVANCSFGKDSLAQIIKIKELGLPLDEVIYCDVRFSESISAEHPLLAKWIPTAEKILFDKFGIVVTHVTSQKTYYEQFYTRKVRGNSTGEIYGFPTCKSRWCNSNLKVLPLVNYVSSLRKKYGSVCSYIGYAFDEQERILKFKQRSYFSPDKYKFILSDYHLTEQDCFDLCKKHDLLSPHYSLEQFRGGCWFCFFQKKYELYKLWRDYPDYFILLENMENDDFNLNRSCPYMHISCKFLSDYRKMFESGVVPKHRDSCSCYKQMSIFDVEYLRSDL